MTPDTEPSLTLLDEYGKLHLMQAGPKTAQKCLGELHDYCFLSTLKLRVLWGKNMSLPLYYSLCFPLYLSHFLGMSKLIEGAEKVDGPNLDLFKEYGPPETEPLRYFRCSFYHSRLVIDVFHYQSKGKIHLLEVLTNQPKPFYIIVWLLHVTFATILVAILLGT